MVMQPAAIRTQRRVQAGIRDLMVAPDDVTSFAPLVRKQPSEITFRGLLFDMAERMGFEPMMEYNPHTRLAGERLQPARPSLRD